MTTAAGHVAGHTADKEKVEKRRALGRGLDSLLPGPRVVPPAQSGRIAGQQQVPHSVRNDNAPSPGQPSSTGTSASSGAPAQRDGAAATLNAAPVAAPGERIEGTIRAVADDGADGVPAELRSAGPPG